MLFIAGGDPAPGVNEAHYLCRLKHFADPSYCRGDLFLESPDAHFTVVWLFAWVTQWVSLETTAWIGRLASWALLAVGWTRLVSRIAPHSLLAPLGAALLVYGTRQWQFAGEWFIGGFEAKSVAYGFVFFALAEAADSRWNRAWLLLGLASAFHALVGGWSVVALGLAGLITGRLAPLRAMLPGLVGGGLLALAGVLPALLLNVGTPGDVVGEANQIYVFFRLPHHLAPLSKGAEWLWRSGAGHAKLVAFFALLTWLRRREIPSGLRLMTAFAWSAEAISLAGLLIELALWNHPVWAAAVLKYYWFRLADIATPIAVSLLLVHWVGEGIAQHRRAPAWGAVALVALCVWHLGDAVVDRLKSPFGPADQAMLDPAAWIEMCQWIEENTPPEAVFLVPQRSHTFKWRAERPEVVTYKDIPQDARSMVEWRRRYEDVFQIGDGPNGERRWTPSLAALGAKRLRELGDEYGARYALSQAPPRDAASGVPFRRSASLPVVHRVGVYTLYDLGEAGSPTE
ncbi:hypothetical protein Pla108_29870 [Botrimarina colliarenosi]|uniref:DUF6798 domain-containing protein n=1 Tax=Botrimarina colliarenosi TaxID=2528001 RepID=A0A5C6A947_9BACT|nr:DUF6798 domain-containing protein [Botrimarina colliarenosi]TWT95910.1 hypothetical protein Pla108_29870 [Botrimarina colliarenosi]